MKKQKIFTDEYIIKRFSRIYIVLLPALSIGFFLDEIGINFFDIKVYENFYSFGAINYNIIDRIDYNIFLFNLFQFQKVFVPTFGSNGALWSLSFEWAYYIIFPLIVLIIRNEIDKKLFFILFTYIILLLFFNWKVLLYSMTWVIGAGVIKINKQLLSLKSSILIFTGSFAIINMISIHWFIKDFILAIGYILILNNLQFNDKHSSYNLKKVSEFFANFSYSLYLFHLPFIVLATSILMSYNKTMDSWFMFIFLLLSSYFYSYINFLFFENRTKKVQLYLLSKISRSIK